MRTAPLSPLAVASALLLASCAGYSPDGGLSSVAETAQRELGKTVKAIRSEEDAAATQAVVERLLKRPLTADAAVQIALLNNRGLQAAFNELGIAEIKMVTASAPPSPTFSASRIAGDGVTETELKLVGDILALATLPARAEVAANRFRQAQLRASEDVMRIATETRRGYYQAVASQQLAHYLGEAQAGAETAARLATRLGEAGNLNKLDQARQQAFYVETVAQRAGASQRADSDRERLIRLMGLWGRDLSFKLPESLPALPPRPAVMPAIERETVRRRIDIQIAKLEVEALAKSLGLTQATRFIDVFELGPMTKTTKTGSDSERQRGFDLELRVPLFDFGESRVRLAEQTYMAAVNRLAETAVNARSQARLAYRGYRSSYDVARHYQDEILPLRKVISDEMMLHYGAMQIDVFSLLADARQRTNANTAAIEAQRDFWLAATTLSATVIGGANGPAAESSSTIASTSAAEDGGGH